MTLLFQSTWDVQLVNQHLFMNTLEYKYKECQTSIVNMTIHICVCVCTYLNICCHIYISWTVTLHIFPNIFLPPTKFNTSEKILPLLIWTRASLIPFKIRIIWQWDPHSTRLPFGTMSMPWQWKIKKQNQCDASSPITTKILRAGMCGMQSRNANTQSSHCRGPEIKHMFRVQQENSVLGDSCTHGNHLLQWSATEKDGWSLEQHVSELSISLRTDHNEHIPSPRRHMHAIFMHRQSTQEWIKRCVLALSVKLAGSPRKSPCSLPIGKIILSTSWKFYKLHSHMLPKEQAHCHMLQPWCLQTCSAKSLLRRTARTLWCKAPLPQDTTANTED